jgi:rod shape determining protein RodA
MANTNYLLLRNYGRGLYLLGILLLVLVLIFGRTLNGTTGWFIIAGLSFQPVEFMKFALVVQLARYYGEHARRRFGWREIIGSGVLTGVPVILLFLQPDLGSAMLLVGVWIMMMLFAGIRIHQVAIMSVVGGIFGWFSWLFLLADYQRNRFLVFLDPSLDPLAAGYNITQARIAIGAGKLFGRGLGFGSQSQLKFLPESQTDFIFAVIAEELGFIGVIALFVGVGIILWRILLHASRSRDNFTGYLGAAIFSLLFVQASVNIGVNMALFPTTGVGLPFVSYGGSSLLLYLVLIGVVESIAVKLRPGERKEQFSWYTGDK